MFRILLKKNMEESLLKKELKIIEDKLGDYIDWYNAIDTVIQNKILHRDEK